MPPRLRPAPPLRAPTARDGSLRRQPSGLATSLQGALPQLPQRSPSAGNLDFRRVRGRRLNFRCGSRAATASAAVPLRLGHSATPSAALRQLPWEGSGRAPVLPSEAVLRSAALQSGGSSTGGDGDWPLYSIINPGNVPSTNSGVSERPQPRDRSPPKPVSASRRNAAFTGSCHRSRAASSRETHHGPQPATFPEFDARRGVPLARAAQPVHRRVPANAGAERTRLARRHQAPAGAIHAPLIVVQPLARPEWIPPRFSGTKRALFQRTRADIAAGEVGGQMVRGGTTKADIVQERKARTETHRGRLAARRSVQPRPQANPCATSRS